MVSLRNALKLAPVFVLALLAVGTSLQVGCSGILKGDNDASFNDDATVEDLEGGCKYGYGYGYRFGYYGYGSGCDGYGR